MLQRAMLPIRTPGSRQMCVSERHIALAAEMLLRKPITVVDRSLQINTCWRAAIDVQIFYSIRLVSVENRNLLTKGN